MSKVSKRLEDKARSLADSGSFSDRDDLIAAITGREIALAIDHIDRLRSLHSKLREDIAKLRRYTDTELIQMEDRTPRYSPYRFPEREKLQKRLISLEKERRELAISEEDKLQDLHRGLLAMLNRHAQLNPSENGHRKTRPKARTAHAGKGQALAKGQGHGRSRNKKPH